MKKFYVFFLILILLVKVDSLYSQTPSIIQFDTIAFNGLPLQPVLKIYINAPSSSLTLSRIDIKSYCEALSDVDSVCIYRTTYNRFSRADFETDWISDVQLITNRKSFSPVDSIASFKGMTFPLQAGDNYFWILLDLSKQSIAGHSLKVTIPKESIVINGIGYPSESQSSAIVPIRKVYFKDNFNYFNSSSKEPKDWTQECLEGCDYIGPFWQSQAGGYGSPDNVGSRNPNTAKSGTYNARLVHPYFTPYSVLLKSKAINLLLATKPTLTFYHAQMNWKKANVDYIDSLSVYYRIGTSGQWKSLSKYTLATPAGKWVKREIILPDEAVNENVFLGFKGTAQWGFGVCIDSVMILETGSEARKINSIIAKVPNLNSVPQSSTKNPVFRMNIRVKGNTGSLTLNSLTITSANKNDNDITTAGVRLFCTADSVYESPILLGTPQSFTTNTITFGSLNRKIETGNNYFWITYDVTDNATPDNHLAVTIKSGDISVTGDAGTWPSTDLSPAGNRIIKQTVFFDDFETDKYWGLRGEFQRGIPAGKGGKPLGGDSYGRPDPTFAYSNANIIGTDLLNDGNYANNLTTLTADTATSPQIDAKYFKNTKFNFYRWLNIESQDSAIIEYKYAGENNWRFLWGSNQNEFQESNWSHQDFDTKTIFDRKKFRIRFRLGPTSVINRYSGWNVDYLFLTGDSIKYDAAVTKYISPKSACSLTSSEHLKVTVKNSGPKNLTNFIIKASIDGGKNWITETIPGPLAIDDSMDYQFTSAFDLSKPAVYNIIVKVANPQDNYSKNDSITYKLTSIPTYNLPYRNSFEKDTSFWSAGGINSSWFQGTPGGDYIKSAPDGFKAWKTDKSGRYSANENSFLESPCFNFSGIEKPIIQLQNSFQTQFKDDGAILEYSLDEGNTWNYINGDTLQFSWRWYNDVIASFSNKKGWTGLIGGAAQSWQITQRFFSEVSNQSKVKFRVSFKTTNPPVSIPRDGFAFDDFQLYEAPYDAGVSEINNLITPACQYSNPTLLKVTVKNFGIKNIPANDTIIIGIKVNNTIVKDTFKLASSLNIKDTRQFTMTKPVNIENPGNYKIKAFVIEKFPGFYNTNNDTFQFNLTVYPIPLTNIPDTIYTALKDTLVVKALLDNDYNYEWKYNSAVVSTQNQISASTTGFGKHYLNVTSATTGCLTKDSLLIIELIPDVGVDSILSPGNNCGYKQPLHPVIRIRNFGTDTMRVNQTIPVKIKLNNGSVLSETITLNKKFAPDSVYVTTLASTLDLMKAKTDTIKIWTDLAADNLNDNDTTAKTFKIFGYPHVFLGKDTVIKDQLTFDLDAGSGFKSMIWNDGKTTTQKYSVSRSGYYSVSVTDNNDCVNSDTIHVHLSIHDLSMQKLVSPVSTCSQPDSAAVTCRIKNTGSDTILITEPIILYYQANNGSIQQDTIYRYLLPDDSVQFTFRKKLSMSQKGSYDIKLKAILAHDRYPSNDSILSKVKVYGNPFVDLGANRIIHQQSYIIDPGNFKSYLWQDNTTDTVWTITKEKFQPGNIYSVTVTDENGCTDRDSVSLFLVINDLAVTEAILPPIRCSMSNNEVINLKITNTGNAPLNNQLVEVSYSLNGGPEIKDNLTFSGAVGAYMIHTFSTPVNMSAKGKYSFKTKVNLPVDINHINDTATYATQVLGFPNVDFKAPNDTFMVKLPYTLHAGPGYSEYLWQDNSTDSIFTVTKDNYVTSKPEYKVIVTDINGCTVTESVNVIVAMPDLAITNMNIPLANCTLSPVKPGITIKNNSNVSITNQEIKLSYKLNDNTEVTKLTTVSLAKGVSQTLEFDSEANLSAKGTYNLNVTLTYPDDVNIADNTKAYEIKVFGNPVVNFGVPGDTVRCNSFPYSIDAGEGYKSYKWNNNTTDRYLNANAEGWYSVLVTTTNECSAKDSLFIRNTTSSGSLTEKATISLYPNPVSNYLYISVNLEKKQSLTMEIISANGKVVYMKKFENMNEYREEVDVSGLPKGFYYVRFYDDESVEVKKIVVK